MLVIRLQRTGRKNNPTYRLVLSEKTKHAKKGALEVFGHYLPSLKQPVFQYDQDRIQHWVKVGAIPSNTVARLLNKAGVKDMEKFFESYTKKKSKNEAPPAPASAPAAPQAEAAAPVAETPPAEEPKAA